MVPWARRAAATAATAGAASAAESGRSSTPASSREKVFHFAGLQPRFFRWYFPT
jgi:hypothetical protein